MSSVDRLVRLVGVDRVQQLAVKECDLDLVDAIVPMNAAGLRMVAGRPRLRICLSISHFLFQW
jgi:hypothetical protein